MLVMKMTRFEIAPWYMLVFFKRIVIYRLKAKGLQFGITKAINRDRLLHIYLGKFVIAVLAKKNSKIDTRTCGVDVLQEVFAGGIND